MTKPNGHIDSEELAMLSRVLNETLREVLNRASPSDAEIENLATFLGTVIISRYEAGEKEPEALKNVAKQCARNWRERSGPDREPSAMWPRRLLH